MEPITPSPERGRVATTGCHYPSMMEIVPVNTSAGTHYGHPD